MRTVADLQAALEDERGWRIRDISNLRRKLLPNPLPRGRVGEDVLALLRPCVAMLYAHWEGFVKRAASAYLHFVSSQALTHDELSPVFLAMAARKHIYERGFAGAAGDRAIVQFMLENGSVRSYLPYKNVVQTRDNLWFEVFQEIFDSLGLSWRPYELRAKLIDTKLVNKRNAIAHGQYIDIDPEDVAELFDFVADVMDRINDQLLAAAREGAYRRPQVPAP